MTNEMWREVFRDAALKLKLADVIVTPGLRYGIISCDENGG